MVQGVDDDLLRTSEWDYAMRCSEKKKKRKNMAYLTAGWWKM